MKSLSAVTTKGLLLLCVLAAGKRPYSYNSTLLTWQEADYSCQNRSLRLATIEDRNEGRDAFLNCPANFNCWIGINDLENTGVFKWLTGVTAVFTSWNTGQPSLVDGQGNASHCGATRGSSPYWENMVCTTKQPFLCSSLTAPPSPPTTYAPSPPTESPTVFGAKNSSIPPFFVVGIVVSVCVTLLSLYLHARKFMSKLYRDKAEAYRPKNLVYRGGVSPLDLPVAAVVSEADYEAAAPIPLAQIASSKT
jgi:Lectin C-type domain